MKKNIIIKLQFSAIHSWPDCDIDEVSYLKYPHRHTFFVTMKFPIIFLNREIEFISLKNRIHKFIQNNLEGEDLGFTSCEMLAVDLIDKFPPCNYVSIFEDNENGAEVDIAI